MRSPAFQFYADDFLAGTFTMNNEERGLYITLLCRQWTQGHVTTEEIARLSPAMAQPSISHVLAKFKEASQGCFQNARMESERSKQAAFRINRSESGKAGAEKRWHSHSTAIAQPMAKHSSPSPSPSPSPNKEEKKKLASLALVDAFELHPELNNSDFISAWNKWHEHLKQKRKPATVHARDLQLAKLSKLGSKKAIDAINHSIEHNWQGIFEPAIQQSSNKPGKIAV